MPPCNFSFFTFISNLLFFFCARHLKTRKFRNDKPEKKKIGRIVENEHIFSLHLHRRLTANNQQNCKHQQYNFNCILFFPPLFRFLLIVRLQKKVYPLQRNNCNIFTASVSFSICLWFFFFSSYSANKRVRNSNTKTK